jgi:NAD(P)-dependent dehydrogenase (short-subunit alcohol dehydrogenase family)
LAWSGRWRLRVHAGNELGSQLYGTRLGKKIPMSQVWLITGSSQGLGRALAEAVLAGGHKLVATPRNPARLANLVECCGDQVRAVALDVTDASVLPFSTDDPQGGSADILHAAKTGRVGEW